MKVVVKILREAYSEAHEQPGTTEASPEQALRKGVRSYLDHPRIKKLLMKGSPEERANDVLLMLAQTCASYGMLKTWEATEGPTYRASREEYTAMADELERMERGPVTRLRAEIETLSREVTVLETKLRDQGGHPEAVQPPFPKTVIRPPRVFPNGPAEERSILARIWRRIVHPVAGKDV